MQSNDIIQDFIAECNTEAQQMGYSDLNEAVMDMRQKVSKIKG